ncbi:MAG: DUF1365 family protein [Streptosporangiaceae bacterium]
MLANRTPLPSAIVPPSQVVVPAIYRCRLDHYRLQGVRRSFRYTVYLWLVDVDDLPRLSWPLALLVSFEPRRRSPRLMLSAYRIRPAMERKVARGLGGLRSGSGWVRWCRGGRRVSSSG